MLLLFILVLKISSLVSDEWNVTMLILKISFGCCIFFSILAGGNLWHKRHNNWKQLNRRSGEVLITLNGLNINGLDFVWTSEPHGLHFWTSKPYGLFLRNIERKSVTLNSGKNFEILVFSMVNNIPIDGGTLQYIECRVPIPFGKELEADYLIKQIKKNVTNQV
jgi:hypothetical protein